MARVSQGGIVAGTTALIAEMDFKVFFLECVIPFVCQMACKKILARPFLSRLVADF